MSNDNSEVIKDKIVEILEKHPEGLTIQQLSEIIGAHRQTITKYVLWLEGAGIVFRRRIGSVTLQYLKKQFEKLKGVKK
jgi:DNA-binding transcriptional ArsR family regulator